MHFPSTLLIQIIHREVCPEGINENLALLITGVAIAAGLCVVYRDITLRLPKRKKKRREAGDSSASLDNLVWEG